MTCPEGACAGHTPEQSPIWETCEPSNVLELNMLFPFLCWLGHLARSALLALMITNKRWIWEWSFVRELLHLHPRVHVRKTHTWRGRVSNMTERGNSLGCDVVVNCGKNYGWSHVPTTSPSRVIDLEAAGKMDKTHKTSEREKNDRQSLQKPVSQTEANATPEWSVL